jgi:hypothetical protein
MERRSKRRLVLVVVALGAVVSAVAYWSTRPSCIEAGPGLRGEVQVLAGKTRYFNGECWTTEPMPPRDMSL